MSYVNVKIFERIVDGGKIAGKEVSVAHRLYADVHEISRAGYQVFPSEEPAYATKFEEHERDAWVAANADFFKVVAVGP